MRSKDAPYAAIGILAGSAWFAFNRAIDFGAMPPLADALTYARVSEGFHGIVEALTYVGDRTFGFPLFLYLVRHTLGAGAQTIALLLVHFAASLYFFRRFRDALARSGPRLHPAVLTLLLAHPGLIAHTAVLLTDTFSSDLVMIALGALIALDPDRASPRRYLLHGAAAGAALGWAIAARPFLIVTLAASLFLALVLWARSSRAKTFIGAIAAVFVAASLVLAPAALHCDSLFGRACLQDPQFAGRNAGQSLSIGLTAVRFYWSVRSPWPSTVVIVNDPALSDAYRLACPAEQISAPAGWLRCLFSKPFAVPVFAYKKLVALLDHIVLQPYAADVTPRAARLYSRAFGALELIGLLCAIGLCASFFRRKEPLAAFAFSWPLLALASYVPMHPEARYGFVAVPILLVSAVWVFQKALARSRRAMLAYLILAALAGAAFLAQTHAWDLDDPVLQQIEGWGR